MRVRTAPSRFDPAPTLLIQRVSRRNRSGVGLRARGEACDSVRMANTNEDLIRQIEALVTAHIASSRRAAQEAVARAFAAAVVERPEARRRARAEASGTKKRRASSELEALGERFYRALCARPGETMTVLAAEVGASAGELHRAVARLKQAGKVRTVGERSSTRYFPLSSSAAA